MRLKLPGTADERARDDAPDAEPFADKTVGDLRRLDRAPATGTIVFVGGDLEDAVGRRVHDQLPVVMCSAPSSSMIAVPDAALLPSTPRPVRRENSARSSL